MTHSRIEAERNAVQQERQACEQLFLERQAQLQVMHVRSSGLASYLSTQHLVSSSPFHLPSFPFQEKHCEEMKAWAEKVGASAKDARVAEATGQRNLQEQLEVRQLQRAPCGSGRMALQGSGPASQRQQPVFPCRQSDSTTDAPPHLHPDRQCKQRWKRARRSSSGEKPRCSRKTTS